jgi:hypothetical protein
MYPVTTANIAGIARYQHVPHRSWQWMSLGVSTTHRHKDSDDLGWLKAALGVVDMCKWSIRMAHGLAKST